MSNDNPENSLAPKNNFSPPQPPPSSPLPHQHHHQSHTSVTKSKSDGALQDELSNNLHSNLLNRVHVVQVSNSTSQENLFCTHSSTFASTLPGDNHLQADSSPLPTNLSDSLASLYLPTLSRQLGTTIMSGLNWINQIDFNNLLQSLVNNTNLFGRRRSSAATLNPFTKSSTTNNVAPLSPPSLQYNSSTLQTKMVAKMLNGTLKPYAKSETIELESFGLVELDNNDNESGIGHDFQRYENERPTWCDACAEFLSPPVMNDSESNISKTATSTNGSNTTTSSTSNAHDNATAGGCTGGIGVTVSGKSNSLSSSTPVAVQTDHLMRTYLQCRKCNYICHIKCHHLIRIDCRPAVSAVPSSSPPEKHLRPASSKPKKNHRNRNSVRFDNLLIDTSSSSLSLVSASETITEAVPSLDSNNNSPDMTSDGSANSSTSSGTADLEPNESLSSPPDSPSSVSFSTSADVLSSELNTATENEVTNLSFDSVFDSSREAVDDEESFVTADESEQTEYLDSESSELTEDSITLVNGENNAATAAITAPCDTRTFTKKSFVKPNPPTLELITPTEVVDLKRKILRYNERIRGKGSGLGITLIDQEKQLFRGFLRVHMNLTRPINVIAGKRPPSIYDIINEEENQQHQRRTLTSFYMPRDTVKNIHITSESTSLQVIKAMLKKFKIVDSPQKFALYARRRFPEEELQRMKNEEENTKENQRNQATKEQTEGADDETNRRFEQTISQFLTPSSYEHSLKRINDQERPLILQLEFDSFLYGAVDIVLQENDNADIAWDAFEVPELKNFLKILDREQNEHLDHVRAHFIELKHIIQALVNYEESKIKQVDIAHPRAGAGPGDRPGGDSADSSFPGSSSSPNGPIVAVES